MKTYKICLIGDDKVGKTSWINRLKTGNFTTEYNYTVGCEVNKVVFNYEDLVGLGFISKEEKKDNKKVCFEIWDTAGVEKYTGLKTGYYTGADGFIIMFDVTNKESYKNVPAYYRDAFRVCGKVPMVIIGNKCDSDKDRVVRPKDIRFHRKKEIHYYDISVKSFYNIYKPLTDLY